MSTKEEGVKKEIGKQIEKIFGQKWYDKIKIRQT
jgi:hypothetical protein